MATEMYRFSTHEPQEIIDMMVQADMFSMVRSDDGWGTMLIGAEYKDRLLEDRAAQFRHVMLDTDNEYERNALSEIARCIVAGEFDQVARHRAVILLENAKRPQ